MKTTISKYHEQFVKEINFDLMNTYTHTELQDIIDKYKNFEPKE